MSLSVKNKYLIGGILIVLLAIFFGGWYLGASKAKSALKPTIHAQSKLISQYVAEIDNHKAYISQIEQEVKTLKQAKKDGDITNEELRKLRLKDVNELTKAKVLIEVLRDSIKHNGRVIIIHDTTALDNNKNAILLPFDFMDKSKFIDLSGGFDADGNMSYNLTIPAEFSVYTGLEKKTKNILCTISTDNPYVKITGLSSIKMDLPREKRFGIGIQAGYGITTQFKASPYIGVGISYNLFRF
jgi:hypothetical protein